MKWKKSGIKNFDLFNKTESSIQIRSSSGGIFTFITLAIIFMLFIYEIAVYRSVELVESIAIDHSRDQSITLIFDITWHQMPCSDVSVDIVDINSQQQVLSGDASIEKVPYIGSNEYIPPTVLDCSLCHPSQSAMCCSCEEVLQFYTQNQILDSDPSSHPQCIETMKKTIVSGNGCRVKGLISLPKIGGNFHVAPGHSTSSLGGGHSHTLNPLTYSEELRKTKLSHTINRLSFGPSYPGMKDPLTSAQYITDKLIRHVYYLRLVPTVYIDNSNALFTYQYSVTNHTEIINLDSFNLQLPGVFFKYEFTPMLVKLERKEKYFSHFITRLCAIIGGTWVVLGLVYSFFKSTFGKFQRKLD